MSKLDTAYGTYKDLISVAKVYTVPRYQRRYSWLAAKQVDSLWCDVERLYRERVLKKTTPQSHFIGSVVVGETANKALGPGACPVIDGQQRLTTLSLLVAAIRDTLVTHETDKAQITNTYLAFHDTAEPRLVLSQHDQSTYASIVKAEGVADQKSLVFRSYQHLVRRLEAGLAADEPDPDELLAEDGTDGSDEAMATEEHSQEEAGAPEATAPANSVDWDWPTLLEVVSGDLELVSISGVPDERAYQIFATLNHGGLKLTQVDLIRNAVFMKLPKLNSKAHDEIWVPLEKRLGERGMGRFLHAWVVRRGHNVPQNDTYESVLHELKTSGVTEEEVLGLLKALASEADAYVLVASTDTYDAEQVAKHWSVPPAMQKSLRFLQEWGNVPAQPLLIEIVTRWREKKISTAVAVKLLRRVESLLARRFIVHTPPNDLRSTLARLTVQVRDVADAAFEATVWKELRDPIRRWPTDAEVLDALVTKPFYRPKSIKQTFLVLRSLAEHLEGKELLHNVTLGNSATSYSVEHVLPQTIEGTTWLKDLEAWGDEDGHHTWNTRRHTIGNLTLTAYNGELSNKSFLDKKSWIAAKLKLQLSKQLLESETWTLTEIEARSKNLAAEAAKLWASPDAKTV